MESNKSYDDFIKERHDFCKRLSGVTSRQSCDFFFESPKTSATLIECLLGMQTELAEVSDIVKKKLLYNKKMNLKLLMEEMGDFLFFWDLFQATLKEIFPREDISDITLRNLNKEKLHIRYPEDCFSLERSTNRNLKKESEVFDDYDIDI